jgi:hypothetical protein
MLGLDAYVEEYGPELEGFCSVYCWWLIGGYSVGGEP